MDKLRNKSTELSVHYRLLSRFITSIIRIMIKYGIMDSTKDAKIIPIKPIVPGKNKLLYIKITA